MRSAGSARLDAIATAVDAAHVLDHLRSRVKPEGVENEAVDMVASQTWMIPSQSRLGRLPGWPTSRAGCGRSTSPPISALENANVDLDFILDVGAFDLG